MVTKEEKDPNDRQYLQGNADRSNIGKRNKTSSNNLVFEK